MELTSFSTLSQTRPAEKCSNKYTFIPTTRALDVLAQRGWFPAMVQEARVRDENRRGFQRHIVRLRNATENKALGVGERFPEAVLINAHDGGAAFSLMMGIHEKVCANGLIVCAAKIGGFRIRHQGFTDDAVFDAIDHITREAPKVLEQVERFQQIELNEDERLAFASSAIELRYDGTKYAVRPEDVLRARRTADMVPSLWKTMNVVQENILRGGVPTKRADGSRFRSRAVNSIVADTRLNQALWKLTEEMARIKNASN